MCFKHITHNRLAQNDWNMIGIFPRCQNSDLSRKCLQHISAQHEKISDLGVLFYVCSLFILTVGPKIFAQELWLDFDAQNSLRGNSGVGGLIIDLDTPVLM